MVGLVRIARVAVDAVRAVELSFAVALAAERADVLALDVVAVDVAGAVAVGDVEVAVGRSAVNVGTNFFSSCSRARPWRSSRPSDSAARRLFALEVGLEDAVLAGGAEVEEFLVALLAQVHAVRAAFLVVAPAFDELAVGVVDVDGSGPVVADENPPSSNSWTMCVSPQGLSPDVWPVGDQLVRVRTGSDDDGSWSQLS
jgi:hypothetical protein